MGGRGSPSEKGTREPAMGGWGHRPCQASAKTLKLE